MSLPDKARFFNIYGDLIGSVSVNCGWWISGPGILRCMKKFPKTVFENPEIHYVELYDLSFPIEMVEDLVCSPDEDAITFLKTFFYNIEIKC